MATRSLIAMELDKGLYKTIYCHNDGYLKHNGAILLEHYSEKQKLNELLELGDISYLGKFVKPNPEKEHSFEYGKRQPDVVVAYGREREELNVEPKIMTLNKMRKYSFIDYFYIFTKENEWKYFDYSNMKKPRSVKEDLEIEKQNDKDVYTCEVIKKLKKTEDEME